MVHPTGKWLRTFLYRIPQTIHLSKPLSWISIFPVNLYIVLGAISVRRWGKGLESRRISETRPLVSKVCELFSGVGVYISRVEEGSVAERAGLRPGDTILEVNGTPFRAVTHEEALKVSGSSLLLSYQQNFQVVPSLINPHAPANIDKLTISKPFCIFILWHETLFS